MLAAAPSVPQRAPLRSLRMRSRACALPPAAQRPSLGNEERNDAATTPPLVTPSAALSARDAVAVQLAALSCNDAPRRDHGLETAYLFASGTGGFGLSRYFGFSAGARRDEHRCTRAPTLTHALRCTRGRAAQTCTTSGTLR
jgi:hypothetical protein